jgi:hypothetical protein
MTSWTELMKMILPAATETPGRTPREKFAHGFA